MSEKKVRYYSPEHRQALREAIYRVKPWTKTRGPLDTTKTRYNAVRHGQTYNLRAASKSLTALKRALARLDRDDLEAQVRQQIREELGIQDPG